MACIGALLTRMAAGAERARRNNAAKRKTKRKVGWQPKPDREPQKRGRKPHEPTPQGRWMVRFASAANRPRQEIADALEISLSTLKDHYAVELREGPVVQNTQVIANLYKQALKDSHQAAKFIEMILENFMGFGGRVKVDAPTLSGGNTTIIIKGGLPKRGRPPGTGKHQRAAAAAAQAAAMSAGDLTAEHAPADAALDDKPL